MIIVGAGSAGLACARALADTGVNPVVLEKSRGVGGRAATRRVDGQPIDHGVVFYHGSDPEFLAALDRVEASPLPGWPERILGDGQPCLPRAFAPGERRVAFAEGVTAFPKSLARDLEVRLDTRVHAVKLGDGTFELDIGGATELETPTLVLTLPVEQTLSLVSTLPPTRALDSIRALLTGLKTEPCLTVLARYPLEAPVPDWHVAYPGESDVLLLASHDSSKRTEPTFHAFVYQCTAAFSRRHLEDDPSSWKLAVLREAGEQLGPWAREPSSTETHRWRFGRANALPLARPVVIELDGGQTLALAGELFHPSLGVEAAYLSGRALAERLAR